MNADQLAAGILEDARKEAEKIEASLREELQAYQKETDALVRTKKAKIMKRIEQQEEQERQRKMATQERKNRLTLLECKQELLDEAYEAAEKKIAKLSLPAQKKMLTQLWAKVSNECKGGTVECLKRDVSFFKGKAKATGTLKCKGGFIAVSKDRTIRVNLTYEALLERVREKTSPDVARILFS